MLRAQVRCPAYVCEVCAGSPRGHGAMAKTREKSPSWAQTCVRVWRGGRPDSTPGPRSKRKGPLAGAELDLRGAARLDGTNVRNVRLTTSRHATASSRSPFWPTSVSSSARPSARGSQPSARSIHSWNSCAARTGRLGILFEENNNHNNSARSQEGGESKPDRRR